MVRHLLKFGRTDDAEFPYSLSFKREGVFHEGRMKGKYGQISV